MNWLKAHEENKNKYYIIFVNVNDSEINCTCTAYVNDIRNSKTMNRNE